MLGKYLPWEGELAVKEETDKYHMERHRRIPRTTDEMFAREVSGMGRSIISGRGDR